MSPGSPSQSLRRPAPRGGVRAGGFTLIELMIVVAIIAIVAGIAIPNLLAARLRGNEIAAISVLRNLCTSQSQFQRAAAADEDNDGYGEYGYMGEMTGKVLVRGGTIRLPTDITQSMASVDTNGEVNRNGYMYRLYLPAPGGVGTREASFGGIAAGVLEPDGSEVHWLIYAWPANYGNSGIRTFFMNQRGEMMTTEDQDYSGSNDADVAAGMALLTTDPARMTGLPAMGTTASDGNFWRPIQ